MPCPMRLGPLPRDDDFFPVRGVGLAHGLAAERALVSRVHIGCRRRELRGARIDALIDRNHAEAIAPGRYLGFGKPSEIGEPCIGEAHRFQAAESPFGIGKPVLTHFGLHIHDRFYPRHKPWIDVAKGINLLLVEAEAQSLGHLQNAVRRRCAERGADDVLVVALPKPLQHDSRRGR